MVSCARYWSQVPLNTTFLEQGNRYTVVVFDITHLDSIRCGIFITADSSKLDGPSGTPQLEALLMDFEDYEKYASNVNEGNTTPVPVDFAGYVVDRDAIANMLWDQYRSEKLKPGRIKAKIRSLKDYAITSLVKSTEYVSKFDPLALVDVRESPSHKPWRSFSYQRSKTAQMSGISQLRGLSCDALAMALAAPGLQSIRTLSIATDVLTRGGVPALVEALRGLPNLEAVYLADMQGKAPTEDSRRTAAGQQVAFVQAMLAMGETALRKKIFCSASYASALGGEPILDGNM
ncbi:hypothetical protein NLG97_g10916 [Lecanicillium saksenae]|uniref:Uncharacterized protein n=1 Tax=Lecanicillium saksenae TaxID=468837 RepID=A0ACC1QFP3_9HYPO|nr:hypothetical protein NLG97_g10916 [Lecanicillium saksenae]